MGMGGFNKASSDAGPELASSGSLVAMESQKALMYPFENGDGGIKTSARSVRIWDRVPMKDIG